MKRLFLLLCAALLLTPSCYREVESVAVLTVQLRLEESPVPVDLEALEVRLQNKTADFSYTAHPDAAGRVTFEVQPGKYDVMASAWFPSTRVAVNGASSRDQIANICWIMEKSREFQKNIYFCFIDCAKAFDCVDHNKLWKNSSRDGNTRPPDLPLEKFVCKSGSNS